MSTQWTHIPAPTRGVITDTPSTLLPKEASPYISGMYLKDGDAVSDFGYVQFPVPGALKSNALNGSFMGAWQFYKAGNSYLVGYTTTNVYQYNSSTLTWDCISKGSLINTAEAAWTAEANATAVQDGSISGVIASIANYGGTVAGTVLVTDVAHGLSTGHTVVISGTTTYDGTYDVTVVDADTFYITHAWGATSTGTWTTSYSKLRGTYSAKITTAAAFTTGLVASSAAIETADISAATNTHIMLWVRASAAVAAGVFRLRLSEQAAGGVGATYADYALPALTTSWQHVKLVIASPTASDGGTYPDDLNAVASVALVANSDPGVVTVYLDDIRTACCLTGDTDNRFSVTTMNDTMIFTNGVDAPHKITESGGVLTVATLAAALATGAITKSEIVITLMDHIIFFNNTENAVEVNKRASWSNIGKIEDYTGGTAGYQDLTNDAGEIISALPISDSEAIVYKEHSIIKMTWVGGQTPFKFTPMCQSDNTQAVSILAKDCVVNIGGIHFVAGLDYFYQYNGGPVIQKFGEGVSEYIYAGLDKTYAPRCFMTYVVEDNELQLWLATSTAYPDKVWCMNLKRQVWYTKVRTMTGFGKFKELAAWTIGDLTGNIGEQNFRIGDALSKATTAFMIVGDADGAVYQMTKSTLNNNGVAITNEFQTPDFTVPDTTDYLNKFMRVFQLAFEVKGQRVDVSYSTDEGSTWSGDVVYTLNSIYNFYQYDFESDSRTIRFRFKNTTVSSGFSLKYYGFYWAVRSGRH